MKSSRSLLFAAAAFAFSCTPALAVTVDNITYSLSESFVSSTATTETWSLTLGIVNNSTDGRTAVTSFAFNEPTGYVTAALPGWTVHDGGLSSSGCNGHGNFFCFSGFAAAAPTMSFTFSLTAAVGAFASYAPTFKIDWVGSQSNYNLVSQALPAVTAPVPEPQTYALMLAGLCALGFLARRRRSD